MAAEPTDFLAQYRVKAPASPGQPAPAATPQQAEQPRDYLAQYRVDNSAPNIPKPDTGLGDELIKGLGQGVNSMQGSLYGVGTLMGRELGIDWLEKASMKGAEKNFSEGDDIQSRAKAFTDIEDAGDVFKWAANSFGQAVPSLALAMTGGGVGASFGKKAVELGVKRAVARKVERKLTTLGFTTEESLLAAREHMTTTRGKELLRDAFLNKSRAIDKLEGAAARKGSMAGAVAVSALPQIGQIDQELLDAGIADPGLTALLGGVLGGALEAVPALRLMDKLFPGVDRQLSKQFVKDFAVATGTQFALEGTTEAAQEMIALAAHAYHDPSFDMFSPESRNRVINAFAAGALVGAMTGGGAEALGEGVQRIKHSAKVAPPAIAAWTMDAADKVSKAATDAAPEGFVAADNTLFQEIKGRVDAAINPHVEGFVNGLRNQVQKVSDLLNENLEGGVNAETASMSQMAKAAHDKFLKDFGPQIEAAKAYKKKQTEAIYKVAESLKDPVARAAYIDTHVAATKEKLSGWMDQLRRAAAQRDQNFQAEVDNIQFPDDVLDDFNIGQEDQFDEEETRVGPSGRKFKRSVGPAPDAQESPLSGIEGAQVGEADSAPVITFGLNQQRPRIGVNGKEDVTPYRTREIAEKGRTTLRKRFPGVKNDDVFRIKQHESGKGWVIEVISPEVMEDQRFFNDLEGARDSASRRSNNPRKVTLKGFVEGHWAKFGFSKAMKNLEIDVQTMAYKGKNIDQTAQTDMEGFLAFAGEMVQRKMINAAQFGELLAAAEKEFANNKNDYAKRVAKEAAATPKPGVVPPVSHGNRGTAQRAMFEFMEEMDLQKVPYPFSDAQDGKSWGSNFAKGRKLFFVEQQKDGTWQWGFNRTKKGAPLVKALMAKDPKAFAAIQEAMKKRRRSEALDEANKKAGDFSGNPEAGDNTGTIGDRTGATAGAPDVTTDPTLGSRADENGNFVEGKDSRLQMQDGDPTGQSLNPESGQQDFATQTGGFGVRPDNNQGQRIVPNLEESRESKQRTDRATNPDELPSEFDTPSREAQLVEGDVAARRTRRTNQNARENSAQDNRILKVIARTAKVKILLGDAFNSNSQIVGLVKDITNFVHKTLGLANDIIVMDDIGLRHLIESGNASNPAFQDLLNDPTVKARNIRIGDKSYIYISPKVLADPALTTLALGHELGHHVYSAAWDKLTPEGQQRLREAYVKDTKNDFGEKGFNEWMADQLAAWITQRAAPKNAIESFFAKVGGQIRRLYDFIKAHERFQLNETFGEFADAVAQRATSAQSPGANPLSDQQQKAWFKNEGVTMYKWFGKALEQDNMTFQPATAAGQQALANITSKYPAIAKRALLLRNWVVNAYNLVAAPSTSVVREIGKRVPAANKLADMFHRGVMGDAKKQSNYHQRKEIMKGQFSTQYSKLNDMLLAQFERNAPGQSKKHYAELVVAKKREIARSLAKKDGDPNATFTPEEQMVRDLYDDMHNYARANGLPVRKVTNYFTRHFSVEQMLARKQEILDHLTNSRGLSVQKARHIFNSLIDPNARDGRATFDATETPGFKAMNSRKNGVMSDPFFDQFQDDNLDGIISNYINSVTKRAEFNSFLGEPMPVTSLDAKKAIATGIWDPKAKMHKILAEAKRQNATNEDLVALEKYIDANLGQLGRDDISPGVRKFMAGVMAYQNMRVLLFTVFASLPDMAGPAIRSGDMKLTWNTLKNHIKEMSTDKGKLAETARAYGIISDTANQHIMTEYVDNHYMSPKMRQMNDAYFKWTGLNWYTDFTRKYALAVGQDFLASNLEKSQSTDPRTKARGVDMLAELGVTPAQVEAWLAAGKPTYDTIATTMNADQMKIAEALVQFVDESIMRPNPAQRPLLASNPAFMLVYHLKGYMYAVHDIVLKRIKFNIDESQSPAQYALAIAPAIAMMLLTAVGLELREQIQYAGSDLTPRTDRMDGWDYTWELAQRAGLTGFAQIGFDFQGAEERGMSHVAGIAGPTVSQIGDWMSKPLTQTIPKAIPVVSQIPALRDQVRKAL